MEFVTKYSAESLRVQSLITDDLNRESSQVEKGSKKLGSFMEQTNYRFKLSMKLQLIDKQILNNSTKSSCVLFLLWYSPYSHWIKLPCNEPVLDKAAVFCVNNTSKYNSTEVTHIVVEDQWKGHCSSNQISNVFLCNDGSYISSQLLCDGNSDCSDSDDETLCHKMTRGLSLRSWLQRSNFTSDKATHDTKKNNENDCHSRMILCLYSIASREERHQKFCFSGYHLANCQDHHCQNTFKCPDSYCLPWRYICDGYWDCPFGYDEQTCFSKHHPGLYHCKDTMIAVLLDSICDFIVDCPKYDDEEFCDLHNVTCPDICFCYLHSIACSGSFVLATELGMRSLPYRNICLTTNESMESVSALLLNFDFVSHLNLSHNTLKKACLDLDRTASSSLVYFDISHNNISAIDQNCFVAQLWIKTLDLSDNSISSMSCYAFPKDSLLESLLLSRNELKRIEACFIRNLQKLKIIDLWGNSIFTFFPQKFGILTTAFFVNSSFPQIFCLQKVNQNIKTPLCNVPCSYLRSASLRACLWTFASFSVILNTIMAVLAAAKLQDLQKHSKTNTSKAKKKHSSFLTLVSFGSNDSFCVYALLAGGMDLYYGEQFALVFQQHLLCHTISIVFLISCFIIPLAACLTAVSRYIVVKHPLHVGSSEFALKGKFFLFLFILYFLGSVALRYSIGPVFYKHTSCLPVGTSSMVLNTSISGLLGSVATMTSIIVPILYPKILHEVIESHKSVASTKPLAKRFVVKTFMISVLHTQTWLLFSAVLLACLFLGTDHLLMWYLATNLPVYTIVSPILLNN